MDPLQWMGAVRMRVQTADKNITIIHTTPVHQLTSWEVKSCVFVRNKSIKTFLTSNRCFWPKCESIIHNIAFSSEKVVWSESGEKSAQTKHRLQTKTALNKYVCGFWFQEMDFSLEEVLLWIMDSYFDQKLCFKVKNDEFVSLLKTLTDGLECCVLLVDYCDVFISCLDSHSDGTHSLQRIHWWA